MAKETEVKKAEQPDAVIEENPTADPWETEKDEQIATLRTDVKELTNMIEAMAVSMGKLNSEIAPEILSIHKMIAALQKQVNENKKNIGVLTEGTKPEPMNEEKTEKGFKCEKIESVPKEQTLQVQGKSVVVRT